MKSTIFVFILLLSACPDNIPVGSIPCSGTDEDGDGVLLSCDNCPNVSNIEQKDSDFDGIGDRCDGDMDNDGLSNAIDLCPLILDPQNKDEDGDGIGDVCDPCAFGDEDSDGDGVADCLDTCPTIPNPDNLDSDFDGVGNACDVCPNVPDAHQNTTEGLGDACNDLPFTIDELSIAELHRSLESGKHTCQSITELFLTRIGKYDLKSGEGRAPRNAFVSFNERVREQARQLDVRQKEEGLGLLHCVPFVVKTLFEAPEVETTAGTHALSGTRSPNNSPSVDRLRKAGALLIASTSMDELARGTAGISSRNGRSGNAYNPNLHAGGSSTGSGIAVGAGFSMFGLGTDNCSSLLLPAVLNGLTAFRSTHQLIELDGMFPSGIANGVAGPMARTVEDLARVMDVMVSPERPKSVLREGWHRPKSYRSFLVENGLEGKRIGILRKLNEKVEGRYQFPYKHASVEKAMEWQRLKKRMEVMGATLIENITLPRFDGKRSGGGFYQELDLWFERVDSPVVNAEGMCRSEKYSPFVWSDLRNCLERLDSGRRSKGILKAEGNRRRFYQNSEYVESVMDALKLDVLLYPTTPYGEANAWGGRENCLLGATTGLPSLNVITSIGKRTRRPYGVTITARNFDEGAAFEIAYALEQATQARTKIIFPRMSDEPPFDPVQENATRLRIGNAASAFFSTHEKKDMNPAAMRDLLQSVLDESEND